MRQIYCIRAAWQTAVHSGNLLLHKAIYQAHDVRERHMAQMN